MLSGIECEEWKAIDGYLYYQVSNLGNVRNTKTGRIIKQSTNGTGYYRVGLTKNKNRTFMFVHKLVACAFIPNPDGKPIADHRDGNKQNNTILNLRWSSRNENAWNRRKQSTNASSCYKGVVWDKHSNC